VIDFESEDRTVSEGQAYAMLRAVLIDDPETFEITLQWAEANLRRSPLPNDSDGEDHLWAWLWGKNAEGIWGVRDPNFASDADIDAITALILAARQWDRPDYLELAQKKLEDLWNQSTLMPLTLEDSSRRRYLLPGPRIAFQPQPGKIYINPSYLAPYAFRLFAEVDSNPNHDWMLLVDSSYDILEQTSKLSQNGLPGDWVMLDLSSQEIEPVSPNSTLKSQYGFDAYRVWWRIAWDAMLFDETRAEAFLSDHLTYLQAIWEEEGRIPAVMNLSGQALVDYEATSQYAMLYPAFQQFAPETAESIRNNKLFATYEEGIWDNPDAYYVQNLAWLGLLSEEDIRSVFADEFADE
jgi:endoglucanase